MPQEFKKTFTHGKSYRIKIVAREEPDRPEHWSVDVHIDHDFRSGHKDFHTFLPGVNCKKGEQAIKHGLSYAVKRIDNGEV